VRETRFVALSHTRSPSRLQRKAAGRSKAESSSLQRAAPARRECRRATFVSTRVPDSPKCRGVINPPLMIPRHREHGGWGEGDEGSYGRDDDLKSSQMCLALTCALALSYLAEVRLSSRRVFINEARRTRAVFADSSARREKEREREREREREGRRERRA